MKMRAQNSQNTGTFKNLEMRCFFLFLVLVGIFGSSAPADSGDEHGGGGAPTGVIDVDELNTTTYNLWCVDFSVSSPLTMGSRIACHQSTIILLFSFLLITTLVLFFELITHFIEHRVIKKDKMMLKILNKVYKELMMIGIVSFLLVLGESFGFFHDALQNVDEHQYLMIFEFVHIGLFVLGLSYALIVVIIALSFFVTDQTIAYVMSKRKQHRKIPFLVNVLYHQIHFATMRARFIVVNHLDEKFQYKKYLKFAFRHTLGLLIDYSFYPLIAFWVFVLILLVIDIFVDVRFQDGMMWWVVGTMLVCMTILGVLSFFFVWYAKRKYLAFIEHKSEDIHTHYEMRVDTLKEMDRVTTSLSNLRDTLSEPGSLSTNGDFEMREFTLEEKEKMLNEELEREKKKKLAEMEEEKKKKEEEKEEEKGEEEKAKEGGTTEKKRPPRLKPLTVPWEGSPSSLLSPKDDEQSPDAMSPSTNLQFGIANIIAAATKVQEGHAKLDVSVQDEADSSPTLLAAALTTGLAQMKKRLNEVDSEYENINRFFFFKSSNLTMAAIEFLMMFLACYFTVLVVYASQIFFLEDTIVHSLPAKIVIYIVLYVPFFFFLFVFLIVLPDFSMLIHCESKTDYTLTKKIIKYAIKKRCKHHYIQIEEEYLAALKDFYKHKLIAKNKTLGH